jgi:hypothetical protein
VNDVNTVSAEELGEGVKGCGANTLPGVHRNDGPTADFQIVGYRSTGAERDKSEGVSIPVDMARKLYEQPLQPSGGKLRGDMCDSDQLGHE